MKVQTLLLTHMLPLWFLVFALFLPRIALVLAWLQGTLAPFHLNGIVPLLFALLLPRVLILFIIYVDQGISFWFLIHLVAAVDGVGRFRQVPDASDASAVGLPGNVAALMVARYPIEIMERRKVGILGATGMVGQRFIQLLHNHPWFEIAWLAASDRSAGKSYAEACRWKLDTPLPAHVAAMTLMPNVPECTEPELLPTIIFAALDADVARELEPKFAAAGCAVISNSSALRMAADVPLVVPEVNADHLAMIERQSWRKDSGGYIVTNPNCCAIGLVLALKPLADRFGIESLFVSTMQAVSGAGYPGVASLDILGNVIPYIKNEEEKLQEEIVKLLGTLGSGGHIEMLDAKLSAHCNRVAVEDGHMECVSIKLRKPATREEVLAAWSEFAPLAGQHLPTAPDLPVEYDSGVDRPQPRLDRMRGHGMASTVGRLRPCSLLDWKFVVLSHNTIRGAAGAAVLNAEVLARLGKLDKLKITQASKHGEVMA